MSNTHTCICLYDGDEKDCPMHAPKPEWFQKMIKKKRYATDKDFIEEKPAPEKEIKDGTIAELKKELGIE